MRRLVGTDPDLEKNNNTRPDPPKRQLMRTIHAPNACPRPGLAIKACTSSPRHLIVSHTLRGALISAYDYSRSQ